MIRAGWLLRLVGVVACAASCVTPGAGATGAPSPQLLTPEIAREELIDLSPIPPSLPTARIDEAAAKATAQLHAIGGPDSSGPITQVVRARAQPDASQPMRTVWVVMFGAGGTVPVPAIAASGGPSRIVYQGVIIDDQTGEFLRTFAISTP